jgi:hypothetical protein
MKSIHTGSAAPGLAAAERVADRPITLSTASALNPENQASR